MGKWIYVTPEQERDEAAEEAKVNEYIRQLEAEVEQLREAAQKVLDTDRDGDYDKWWEAMKDLRAAVEKVKDTPE